MRARQQDGAHTTKQVVREGLEQGAVFSEETAISTASGAESGALGAQLALIDPELLAIVEAWPELPDSVRAGVVALIRATAG